MATEQGKKGSGNSFLVPSRHISTSLFVFLARFLCSAVDYVAGFLHHFLSSALYLSACSLPRSFCEIPVSRFRRRQGSLITALRTIKPQFSFALQHCNHPKQLGQWRCDG